MKIALIQLRTELDYDETMVKAEKMLQSAAKNAVDIAVLPEMFNCAYTHKYMAQAAQFGHEHTVKEMSRWARELGIYLVGGSVLERDGEKCYNTSYVFDRKGVQIAKHRKVHLFDIDLPDMHFCESETFAPGNEVTVFDTEFGKMGLAICFDLRFPELFRAMALRGAQVIFLPAQFNTVTGPAHWEMLLRARAVDNEVFVAAASAARFVGFKYECWGHSTVTDPYGAVLKTCDEKEQILYAKLDLNRIPQVRAQLPTIEHLREDVYKVAD